jgi:hypothetical protein
VQIKRLGTTHRAFPPSKITLGDMRESGVRGLLLLRARSQSPP